MKTLTAIFNAMMVFLFLVGVTIALDIAVAQIPNNAQSDAATVFTQPDLSVLWLNEGMAAEFERSQAALAKLPKGSPIVRQRPTRFQFVMEGQAYEIGFREDGVVVWKKSPTR